MSRDRDDPIQEFEEDSLDGRRLIPRSEHWFDTDQECLAAKVRAGETGFPLVRWKGCLWHLKAGFDRALRRSTSFCGEEFDERRQRIETKVDIDPMQALVCMECWEIIQAVRVAMILSGGDG